MDQEQEELVLKSFESLKTPDDALEELMEGNRRFASGQTTLDVREFARLREESAKGQKPYATVLACSDSREPVELIFDEGIGRLFVVRVAGNIVAPDVMASLEFGAAVLGTKIILVLGHKTCGAIKATMEAKPVPGQISSLFPYMQPAVDRAAGDYLGAVQGNAQFQADLAAKASPILRDLVSQKKLKVASGWYDISTGRVSLL